MNLRCVIVDDEPLAITIIEGYLKKIPYIEIIGKFDSAIPVYEFLKENNVDLLLLDIEMPNITGVDFLKSLTSAPSVIFTTANKNYALDGFDLNVEDYILKPITFERLFKSINRVYEKVTQEKKIEKKDDEVFLYLKENKKMVKVYFKNILYLESIKDYVKVVTLCKTVTTKQQLSYFESVLDDNKFLRIHRSFIVATNKIDAYSLSGIDIGNMELPIGRKYKEIVIERLEKLNRIKNN
ncbi:LytR/AlgR family response regulator transcription factor [Bacteroidota bacterium]